MEAALRTYQEIGARERRDRLVTDHLPFVRRILHRLLLTMPDHVDIENLEAAGVLGLVEAANRFDPARDVDFKTFAYQRIRGAILDELRRNCPLPQQMLEHWAKIRQAVAVMDPPVTALALAQATGLELATVEECLLAIRMTRPEVWSEELIPRATSADADEGLLQDETRRILVEEIERLPERPRIVLTLYHLEELTLKQIGEVIGRSESRVSRMLTEAELRLRSAVERRLKEK